MPIFYAVSRLIEQTPEKLKTKEPYYLSRYNLVAKRLHFFQNFSDSCLSRLNQDLQDFRIRAVSKSWESEFPPTEEQDGFGIADWKS